MVCNKGGFEYKFWECKRYRLWSRKSSFGTADTLIDAREGILMYALRRLEGRKVELMSKSKMDRGKYEYSEPLIQEGGLMLST